MSLARFVLSVRERLLQLTAGIAYKSFPRRLSSQPQYPSLTIVSISLPNNSTLHVTSRQRQTQTHHLGSFIRPQHLARLNVLVPYLKLPCPPKRHMTLGDLQSTYSHDLRPSQDDRASLPIGLILRRIASLACMEGDVEVCMEAHVTLFPVRSRRRCSLARALHVFKASFPTG